MVTLAFPVVTVAGPLVTVARPGLARTMADSGGTVLPAGVAVMPRGHTVSAARPRGWVGQAPDRQEEGERAERAENGPHGQQTTIPTDPPSMRSKSKYTGKKGETMVAQRRERPGGPRICDTDVDPGRAAQYSGWRSKW